MATVVSGNSEDEADGGLSFVDAQPLTSQRAALRVSDAHQLPTLTISAPAWISQAVTISVDGKGRAGERVQVGST